MEDIDYIHSLLLNFFNVVIVNENPTTISNIVKRDDKLETITSVFNLNEVNISDINKTIFDEFSKYEKISIDFNSKSFFGKIFKLKNYYNIYKLVNNNEWIICSSKHYKIISKIKTNIYINDYFDDLIVIGNNPDLLLKVDDKIEYYLDSSNINVYKLE